MSDQWAPTTSQKARMRVLAKRINGDLSDNGPSSHIDFASWDNFFDLLNLAKHLAEEVEMDFQFNYSWQTKQFTAGIFNMGLCTDESPIRVVYEALLNADG